MIADATVSPSIHRPGDRGTEPDPRSPNRTSGPVALWAPPLDRISGGNLYDRELVRHLEQRGHRVHVRTFRPGETATSGDAESAGTLIQDELLHRAFTSANRRLRGRTGRPRIIALVHHLACNEPERSEGERWRLQEQEGAYLATVDAVVAPSGASARAAVVLAGRDLPFVVAPPGRGRLGGGPMPSDRPGPEDIRDRARQPLRAAFVGNLIPRKRVLELLAAVAVVPEWRLVIAGRDDADPAYAARVRALARADDLRSRVEFEGQLDPARLAALLRRSHLLAVPSTHEGFGMVYLEGFAFGLPALAASSGGAPELVTEGVTGFLIPVGDPTSRIASRLRTLADDRGRLARMGRAARARYDAHPSWTESLDAVHRLLSRI